MICSDCGARAIALYAVDGTTDRICLACVKEARDVGAMHAYAIRIHRSVHGTDDPRCPKCAVDAADAMLWGGPDR